MLCVLLAYIFLVGPDVFQSLARADVPYSQLTTSTWAPCGSNTISYAYDANGSQVYKIYAYVQDIDTMTLTAVQEWLDDQAHANVAYDHHEYNLQNRLSQIKKYDISQDLTETVAYQYNTQGIRIQKTEDFGSTPIVTDYLIDPYNHTG